MVIIQLGCSDMNLNVYIKRLAPLMIKYFILFPSVSRDIHLHQSHPSSVLGLHFLGIYAIRPREQIEY